MEQRLVGIILGKYDVGEADRLYTFFTSEKGKIQAVAKGVRKSQARLAGSLENFNLVSFTVVGKGGTKKITHAVVENNFSLARGTLESLRAIFRSAAIANRLVEKEEKDEKLFHLILEYLQAMEKATAGSPEKIDLLSSGFLLKMLDILGYRFEVSKCANCGGSLRSGKFTFNSHKGGTLCDNCSKGIKENLTIQPNSIKAVRIIYQNKLQPLFKLVVGKKEINDLKKITDDYLRWIAK